MNLIVVCTQSDIKDCTDTLKREILAVLIFGGLGSKFKNKIFFFIQRSLILAI